MTQIYQVADMTGSRNLAGNREQTKSELLERRMLMFAADSIRALDQSKSIPRAVNDQLTRSSASVGANYAEACNAYSKLDFKNKIYTSKKEAAESRYWIDLCIELAGNERWHELRDEAQALLMILQTIANSLRSGSAK